MPSNLSKPSSRSGLIAWAMYDWANSAFAAVIQTFVFAAYFTNQVASSPTLGSTLWGNTIGAAGLLVAVGGPILGAVADQTGRRKPWIVAFTILSVLTTALLWFVTPSTERVWMALVLVAVGTVGFEYATIFYNAMLPSLSPRDQLGRWSGWSWGLGYVGGLACLIVALFVFISADASWAGFDRASAEHVRATFVMVAAWYLLFALPLFFITPDERGTGLSASTAVRDGLRQLARSLRQARQYGHILRFLIARMIYIDGLATVFAFGGVYAAGTFKMSEEQVLLFGIGIHVTAAIGAAAFAWIDDWIGGKRTILLSLVGLLASGTLILVVESTRMFWVFGMLLGVFVGPAQAASRSLMARVAPEHLRTEMFGLYAFSGKATAFLGPLLVGWTTYATGNQRLGMGTVLVFFTVGFVLMLTVPRDTPGEG